MCFREEKLLYEKVRIERCEQVRGQRKTTSCVQRGTLVPPRNTSCDFWDI